MNAPSSTCSWSASVSAPPASATASRFPHGKLPEIKELFGLFARLDEPVDFDAIDEQPVDLVFLLLAPEGAGADHLKALARVSRLLRDKSVCEKLRGADQTDAIYALLTDTAKSHAA